MDEGRILAGHPVRLACARHLRDLDELTADGYRFDEQRANHALDFFPRFLRLAEGDHAGKPFVLQPWQQFIIGSLFGWLGPDGFRRFRTAYIEAAKGCGKTPMLAGMGLYGITCDDEPSAQVFAAAVTREQAAILFADAKAMAAASPYLSARLDITEHNIAHLESRSFFRPVSSEGRSLDAKRVHMALIDELHEHPLPIVVDKLRAGTKGRRQALIAEITNSGYDRQSVCWKHHEYSLHVLERIFDDPSWFGYVCQLDPCDACRATGVTAPSETCPDCDDWRNEACWLKVNPNLDVSVPRKYLRELVREAEGMPEKQAIVQRLNFCIWNDSVARWFTPEVWAKGAVPVDPTALRGRRCIAGMDLSWNTDLSAVVLAFPDDEFFATVTQAEDGDAIEVTGGVDVLAFFWCPEDGIRARSKVDRVPYELWRTQGYLEATPGNVIDRKRIRQKINELRDVDGYDIVEIAYDPAYAQELAQTLQDEDGFTLTSIRQTCEILNEPVMLAEQLVLTGRLRHGGHPILTWNAANVVVVSDGGGRRRLDKGRSMEHIDGMSALIDALKRLFMAKGPASVYQTRGLITV